MGTREYVLELVNLTDAPDLEAESSTLKVMLDANSAIFNLSLLR